jgi:hypothetical protein
VENGFMEWCKGWIQKLFIQMGMSMKEKLYRERKLEIAENTFTKIVINTLGDFWMTWNILIMQFCTWIAKELCTMDNFLKTKKLIQKLKLNLENLSF